MNKDIDIQDTLDYIATRLKQNNKKKKASLINVDNLLQNGYVFTGTKIYTSKKVADINYDILTLSSVKCNGNVTYHISNNRSSIVMKMDDAPVPLCVNRKLHTKLENNTTPFPTSLGDVAGTLSGYNNRYITMYSVLEILPTRKMINCVPFPGISRNEISNIIEKESEDTYNITVTKDNGNTVDYDALDIIKCFPDPTLNSKKNKTFSLVNVYKNAEDDSNNTGCALTHHSTTSYLSNAKVGSNTIGKVETSYGSSDIGMESLSYYHENIKRDIAEYMYHNTIDIKDIFISVPRMFTIGRLHNLITSGYVHIKSIIRAEKSTKINSDMLVACNRFNVRNIKMLSNIALNSMDKNRLAKAKKISKTMELGIHQIPSAVMNRDLHDITLDAKVGIGKTRAAISRCMVMGYTRVMYITTSRLVNEVLEDDIIKNKMSNKIIILNNKNKKDAISKWKRSKRGLILVVGKNEASKILTTTKVKIDMLIVDEADAIIRRDLQVFKKMIKNMKAKIKHITVMTGTYIMGCTGSTDLLCKMNHSELLQHQKLTTSYIRTSRYRWVSSMTTIPTDAHINKRSKGKSYIEYEINNPHIATILINFSTGGSYYSVASPTIENKTEQANMPIINYNHGINRGTINNNIIRSMYRLGFDNKDKIAATTQIFIHGVGFRTNISVNGRCNNTTPVIKEVSENLKLSEKMGTIIAIKDGEIQQIDNFTKTAEHVIVDINYTTDELISMLEGSGKYWNEILYISLLNNRYNRIAHKNICNNIQNENIIEIMNACPTDNIPDDTHKGMHIIRPYINSNISIELVLNYTRSSLISILQGSKRSIINKLEESCIKDLKYNIKRSKIAKYLYENYHSGLKLDKSLDGTLFKHTTINSYEGDTKLSHAATIESKIDKPGNIPIPVNIVNRRYNGTVTDANYTFIENMPIMYEDDTTIITMTKLPSLNNDNNEGEIKKAFFANVREHCIKNNLVMAKVLNDMDGKTVVTFIIAGELDNAYDSVRSIESIIFSKYYNQSKNIIYTMPIYSSQYKYNIGSYSNFHINTLDYIVDTMNNDTLYYTGTDRLVTSIVDTAINICHGNKYKSEDILEIASLIQNFISSMNKSKDLRKMMAKIQFFTEHNNDITYNFAKRKSIIMHKIYDNVLSENNLPISKQKRFKNLVKIISDKENLPVIIFTSKPSVAKSINDKLKDIKEIKENEINLVSITSKTGIGKERKEIMKDRENMLKVIVTTTGVLNRGFNLGIAKSVVIYENIPSLENVMQSIGRIERPDASSNIKAFIFDDNTPWGKEILSRQLGRNGIESGVNNKLANRSTIEVDRGLVTCIEQRIDSLTTDECLDNSYKLGIMYNIVYQRFKTQLENVVDMLHAISDLVYKYNKDKKEI